MAQPTSKWEKLIVLRVGVYRDRERGICISTPPFSILMVRQVALLHIPKKKQFFSPISQILPWSYETSNREIINWGDLTIMKALS